MQLNRECYRFNTLASYYKMTPTKYILGICLVLLVFESCQRSGKYSYTREWREQDRTYLVEHLHSTIQNINDIVDTLTEQQWFWRQDSSKWSIADVLEHLIVHDELFYREVKVLSSLPKPTAVFEHQFASDSAILSYQEVTPTNVGKAPFYLEPMNRWCNKEDALQAYAKIRTALIAYLETTELNLRAYYTKIGRGPTEYRDLHQLLLISVAHTTRHTNQILAILQQDDFPY